MCDAASCNNHEAADWKFDYDCCAHEPCAEHEGDCDSDDECAGDLVCHSSCGAGFPVDADCCAGACVCVLENELDSSPSSWGCFIVAIVINFGSDSDEEHLPTFNWETDLIFRRTHFYCSQMFVKLPEIGIETILSVGVVSSETVSKSQHWQQ